MVEKLSKALEGLKNIQFSTAIEDSALRKKQKMLACSLVDELMTSLRFTNAQNLSQLVAVVEYLILLCDDKDSDVRMVADESLNRIIRVLTETNFLNVQAELIKEIKKNGSARCLRAALWRFGLLSSYIRPNKGRINVQNLLPSIIEISCREEESIHETLATFIENTFKVLGVFIQDNDIKSLLKAFLLNLSSSNPVIRRTAACCINSTVKHSRKPHDFNSYVLNTLLDYLIPVSEDTSVFIVLGVLVCLRMLLPNLSYDRDEEGISGSFGLRLRKDESQFSVDKLIQIYEICLHYSKSKDHNVVTASLETLNQLLQNPPHQLEWLLVSPSGFSRSYIMSTGENIIRNRTGSELSLACSLPPGIESLLYEDAELTSFDYQSSITVSNLFDSKQSSTRTKSKFQFSDEEIKMVDNPFKEKLLGEIFEEQLTPGVDSDAESLAPSEAHTSSFVIEYESQPNEPLVYREFSRSNSRDELYQPLEGETLGSEMQVDIGDFTDQEIPLNFCARHLAASFLLDGTKEVLKSDQSVRVSIKSLAITCISAILKLHPKVLKLNLAKNNVQVHNQEMSDLLLLSDHSDPQIRGNIVQLVATFINSVVLESKGFECDWISEEESSISFKRLFQILCKGVKDESSSCSRQALSGLHTCLKSVFHSVHLKKVLPILHYIPSIPKSSYWLVKVRIAELVSAVPFVCMNELTGSNVYQDEIIDNVLIPMLEDEDSRVRTGVAESLARMIPTLYFGNSTLLVYSKDFTAQIKHCLRFKKETSCVYNRPQPFPPFNYIVSNNSDNSEPGIEGTLSRIIAKLTYTLTIAVNKYFVYGCIEALKVLSEKYPPTVYTSAWNCSRIASENEENDGLTSNLLTVILSLLITSPIILDLSAFNNSTVVLGNLFAGHCSTNMKNNYQIGLQSPVGDQTKYWNALKSDELSLLAERIFTHVMKVLNIYSHLLEELPLSKATAASAAAASSLLPLSLSSPIKKQDKKIDKEDKSEERKMKNLSNYKQSSQYLKLYHLLKSAHNSYKASLDTSASEKFLSLLESTVNVLSIILEIGTVHDVGRCAEEILSYLRHVITLRASPSVLCVIQLLKSLFGTNLGSNWENLKTEESDNGFGSSLFANIYQLPSELLYSRINNHSITTTLESENLTGSRRRMDRKFMIQNSDKNLLATYIRLFEPMVIKSLQLYTRTNNVILQSNVLQLMIQLIQARINYCLLDSDEIFIGFVLNQFELIEHGLIPGIEKLLPEIFKFLLLLSYEKHHSKNIISVPTILQLCDRLMASNQSTRTHCIPALIPIVEDVFLSRTLVSSSEQKELETQREVVLAMLLRLVEFHEVMNMLTLILNESHSVEEKERWKKLSRQVIDIILPLASQDRLKTETFEGQEAFNKIMSSLSPNVLRPIDPLLKVLFLDPKDYNCPVSVKRWLSRVTVIIETLLHVKEDVLLRRLEEVSPNVNLSTYLPPQNLTAEDPFNVKMSYQKFEPPETFARLLLKVISVAGYKILESISTSHHLQQQLSIFFSCVFHLLKSGTFHRLSNSLQILLTTEPKLVAVICNIYVNMIHFAPILSSQFLYLLALLNYFESSFWTKVMFRHQTLSSRFVQSCAVISLSDYLCEVVSDKETLHFLLSSSIEEVISLSNEAPVKELISMIHKRSESSFLMDLISSRCTNIRNPAMVEKLLRILEISHNSHSGFLLSLLVKQYLESPYVALSRLASMLACRRAEYLLALPPEETLQQLNKDEFSSLIAFVNNKNFMKRHSTLIGLLNKLSVQVYSLPLLDTVRSNMIDTARLKTIILEEKWYSAQVRLRCCQETYSGYEIASLLSVLNFEKIMEIIASDGFRVELLKDCLQYLHWKRKKTALDDAGMLKEPVEGDPLYNAIKLQILNSVAAIVKTAGVKSDSGTVTRNEELCSKIWKFSPLLSSLLDTFTVLKSKIDPEFIESVMGFGVLCLEILASMASRKRPDLNQDMLESGLACCISVLKNDEVRHLISQLPGRTSLMISVQNTFTLVNCLIPQNRLSNILGDKEFINKKYLYNELRLMDILLMCTAKKSWKYLLPTSLKTNIRELVVCLCRIPELSAHIVKVPETTEIQDLETLEIFISTFSEVSWTSRQQFEEIWMGLLAVLGFSNQSNVFVEETSFIVQASTVAIEGITVLLKSTLVNPVTRKIIHYGRNSTEMKKLVSQLPVLVNVRSEEEFGDRAYHYLDNLEIPKLTDRYQYGLLSVEFIWTAVKQISSNIELYEIHTNYLDTIGLDLTSCVHLLMELYNQWVFQASSPDIRIITSCLRSSIVISDLFTDIAQFQWLLDLCLYVEHLITTENVVVLPLIILGSCKAVSIVLPDLEVCEKVKRLMLHSHSTPCRIATIQGLLFLLQSPVVQSAQTFKTIPPTYEANFVANIVDMFLPIAIDAIQEFMHQTAYLNEEYETCAWALFFYVLQHYHMRLSEIREEMLNFSLTTLRKKDCSDFIMKVVVRGIERLLLTSVIGETFTDQVAKAALDMTLQSSIVISRCGLQLLMVLSFLEKRAKDIRLLVTGQEDPEKIMRDMEKINVLFEKLKKSYPEEAEVVGDVISYILMDFSASDVLTKVIQEFLSSQQPHLKILSGLLFEVFGRAELSLLEDWVVFTLPSFIQGLPVTMSIWTLNCFFVSASNEAWLRSMFPLVQSRMRMIELEDRELLCLSGSYFYKQLKDPKQKKLFLETFENAVKTHSVFSDLLASL